MLTVLLLLMLLLLVAVVGATVAHPPLISGRQFSTLASVLLMFSWLFTRPAEAWLLPWRDLEATRVAESPTPARARSDTVRLEGVRADEGAGERTSGILRAVGRLDVATRNADWLPLSCSPPLPP